MDGSLWDGGNINGSIANEYLPSMDVIKMHNLYIIIVLRSLLNKWENIITIPEYYENYNLCYSVTNVGLSGYRHSFHLVHHQNISIKDILSKEEFRIRFVENNLNFGKSRTVLVFWTLVKHCLNFIFT